MEYSYIGIDPGNTGAMCNIAPITRRIRFISNKKSYMELSIWLKNIMQEYEIKVIMIEDVHSIYGASAKSNMNFGRSIEKVHALTHLSGFTPELVQPKKWQSIIGVRTKGKDIKNDVMKIISKIYPELVLENLLYGPRGGFLDGHSDACAIAHYAYLTYVSRYVYGIRN